MTGLLHRRRFSPVFLDLYLLFLTLGLRVLLGLEARRWEHGLAHPMGVREVVELSTGWLLPLYFGMAVSARDRARFPLAAGRLALLTLLVTLAVRSLRSVGTWTQGLVDEAFMLGAPLSIYTGGLVCCLDRLWRPQEGHLPHVTPEPVPPPEATPDTALTSLRRGIWMLAAAAAVSLSLYTLDQGLYRQHFSLTASDRSAVGPLHAVVFITADCPHCRILKPVLDAYQRAHPELRIRRVNQRQARSILLRDRLKAVIPDPAACGYSVPAMLTTDGWLEGAGPIQQKLLAWEQAPPPLLASRLLPR